MGEVAPVYEPGKFKKVEEIPSLKMKVF